MPRVTPRIGLRLAQILAAIGTSIALYVTLASRGFESAQLAPVLTGAALLGVAASAALAVLLPRSRVGGPALIALGLVGLVAWPYLFAGAFLALSGLIAWISSVRIRAAA